MKIQNDLLHSYRIACSCDANVLITGPTGSGKTTLAQQLHDNSNRKGKAFVVLNLATIHQGTLESELFGHERGAFTGAEQKRIGRLELANGGTVFLDEVAELPCHLQARLLEFLQSKTITPMGSNRSCSLDLRIIAATNKDLAHEVQQGRFREDLFHRLRVFSLHLRAISERYEEFDELIHGCLQEACQHVGKSILRLSESVVHCLEVYAWPGNLRELCNVLEYAVVACGDTEIKLHDLPLWFLELSKKEIKIQGPPIELLKIPMTLNYHETLTCFEKEYLTRVLSFCQGRLNRTAREIGLSKTTLLRRVRAHGIPYPKTIEPTL